MTSSSPSIFAAARAALVAACLALAPIPSAQAGPELEGAEEAIRQGAKRVLRALDALMKAVPQYEAPEILDNGDIIIRRKRPNPSDAAPGAPDSSRGDGPAT